MFLVLTNRDRRPSEPLITGDGFRAFVDFICDEDGCPILGAFRAVAKSPEGLALNSGLAVSEPPRDWRATLHRLLPGWLVPSPLMRSPPAGALLDMSVVFVKADLIEEYLAVAGHVLACRGTSAIDGSIHRSSFRHIVLSHEGDRPFTSEAARLLTAADCVEAFYAQNIEHGVTHPRLRALPIGLEDRHRMHGRERGAFAALNPMRGVVAHAAELDALLARFGVDASGGTVRANHSSLPAGAHAASSALAFSAFSVDTNPKSRCAVVTLAQRLGGLLEVQAGGDVAGRCGSSVRASAASRTWAGVAAADVMEALRIWGTGPKRLGSVSGALELSPATVGSEASTMSAAALLPPHLGHVASFLRSLGTHAFALSPEGNGVQCHRTWEALLSGATAVVTKTGTAVDELYSGLPVLLLRDWGDLDSHSSSSNSKDSASSATRLLLGVAIRVRRALANTLRDADLARNAGRNTPLLIAHAAPDATPLCWPPTESANNPLCSGDRVWETFPFDPALARVPSAELSPLQLFRLERSVLRFERLYLPHWLAEIQALRVRRTLTQPA